MSKDTEYIATLIDFTVSEDNERVDLEACLEIADRANATKPECNEAIKSIAKCLGKSNMKIVLNTLQLLETMCKNCNQRFLYELNNKKLVDAILKLLQRRRDKARYGSKITKSSNQLKADAEDKALYLLQLWADTFMMHQAEFRNIHDAYRNLRKDSVMFPERDPNQKFMINFQGQVSPVFLAMEGNVTVPSNNQGGPISDSRRSTTTTNHYKPKPTEYKHEVQNTLYDENDEDYDYSAYDGIQITAEEVRILEESMGILKEIERNATKPADMKGDIAKEILSDLVHVHKRLKRFITSEKFASPAHKNEAIRLNQVLSACLSSYKTKYYKLKDDLRKIRTEPDEGFRGGRYRADTEDNESAPKNVQRLATEYDESAYAERIKPSDLTRDKKGEVKKATFTGNNKLAPPTGWKAPTQDLAPNPDLIDLLNTRDSAPANKPSTTTQKPVKKVEESKEDPNKRAITSPDLLTDLLDLNFGGPSQPQNNANGAKSGARVNNQPLNTDIGSTSKNDFFDFGNFGSPTPKKPNVLSPTKGVVQPQFMSSTPKKPVVQPQFTTSPPTFTEPNAPVKNLLDDDDDFFNDLASRKK